MERRSKHLLGPRPLRPQLPVEATWVFSDLEPEPIELTHELLHVEIRVAGHEELRPGGRLFCLRDLEDSLVDSAVVESIYRPIRRAPRQVA